MLGFLPSSAGRCGRLKVTGNPNPDCTGEYREAGVYDGKPYYARIVDTFKIYWKDAVHTWFISPNLGQSAPSWISDTQKLISRYSATVDYTGYAFVEID